MLLETNFLILKDLKKGSYRGESKFSPGAKPKNYSESELHFAVDNQKIAGATNPSPDEDAAKKNCKRFYASRIIKRSSNDHN